MLRFVALSLSCWSMNISLIRNEYLESISYYFVIDCTLVVYAFKIHTKALKLAAAGETYILLTIQISEIRINRRAQCLHL